MMLVATGRVLNILMLILEVEVKPVCNLLATKVCFATSTF